MYHVYILYSSSIDRYYIGYSSNAEERLKFHNSSSNKIWSKRGQPWVQKIVIECSSKSEALKIERFIKSKKSRAYIQNVIENGKLK